MNASAPTIAGAVTVHVRVPDALEQAELLGVRFVAVLAGEPVKAAPLTLVRVMSTDWVELETNFGPRVLLAVVAAAGTAMVKRAIVCVDDVPGPLGLGATDCVPPPPHAESSIANSQTVLRTKIPLIIQPARSRS